MRGYGTDKGVCDLISPLNEGASVFTRTSLIIGNNKKDFNAVYKVCGLQITLPLNASLGWADILPESRPGINNGMTILVDAETFDQGTSKGK